MGVKRPLEEENLPELSFKQPIQEDNKRMNYMTEDLPSHTTALRVDSPGEAKSNFCELHCEVMSQKGDTDGASIVDKKLEASAPLSLVPDSSREEGAGNKDTSFLYNFPGYIDLSTTLRPPEQFEDPYVFLLNSSPRKEVPVGPDYQAVVPNWDPSASRKDMSGSNNYGEDDRQQELMGTCIIPTRRLNGSSIDGFAVGRGRTDCSCLDMGSMRCVLQHVQEAKERLRETIGDETFTKLGFYDMGEEVCWEWASDDEQVFHEVVYSNPVSHGRDFWKLLASVFPTRTKKELVSYYFNVFMLRRRAVQNRSFVLQIDSDDDEEHKGSREVHGENESLLGQDTDDENDLKCAHGDLYLVREEDEDSAVESLGDQELDAGWVDEYGSGPENVCGDEDNHNIDDTCDGNVGKEDDVERDPMSREETKK